MHDQLLDYLLDQLDEPARLEVEARLKLDPDVRREFDVLRQALEPLAVDAEIVPPQNLAARAIAHVAEHLCTDLPKAPVIARIDGSSRAWWRRADVLVAASLLLIFVGIGIPAIFKIRSSLASAAIVECANNLREFHVAMQAYKDQHGTLPVIVDKTPRDVAGMVAPVLKEAGVLPATFNVSCPAHGVFQPCSLTHAELQALPAERFAQEAPKLLVSYAYSLGYRDANNVWHAVARPDDQLEAFVPLLADTPPAGAAPGNSLNHGGRGQNILYLDGHVRFLTLRSVAGDDLFLNRANRVAAGLDCGDAVLGYSAARP
jgi:prepilin-type processing-associated H-X9-DG protein